MTSPADAAVAKDGLCTLREAIVTTNSNAQLGEAEAGDCAGGQAAPIRDVIEFELGAGVQTIAVGATGLPSITDPVEIDGSQGSEVESQIRVQLDGSAVEEAGTHHGLFLTTGSDGSEIHNVAVFDFPDDGIYVFSDENVVEWVISGMNEAGEAKANGRHGVTIRGERNVISRSAISGNAEHGINVEPRSGANGAENTIRGSRIGTNKSGTAAVPNGSDGIYLALNTLEAGGDDLTIGGPEDPTPGEACDGDCNLISGNSGNGIVVRVSGSGEERTTGLKVQGNYIGTNVAGTAAIANSGEAGVKVWGGTVGAAIDGNVISGNERGVLIVAGGTGVGAADTSITGNVIGLGADESTTIPNTTGILVTRDLTNGPAITGTTIGGPEDPTPGEACDGDCNLISGNSTGIVLIESTVFAGGAVSGTEILGNYIGTDGTGTEDRGNSTSGLELAGLSDATVGAPGSPNVISGNDQNGVRISAAEDNVIAANLIGLGADAVTALGNAKHGVEATNAAALDTIGGTATGAGNAIANNGEAGVALAGLEPVVDMPILGNAIFGNGGLGIDILPDFLTYGVTENGECKEEVFANRCQEFPVLTAAAGGSAVAAGTLSSDPNKSFRIEVFASSAADPSGNGEGERFLGSTTATTDGAGNATWLFADPAATLADGEVASATATELGGGSTPLSTSEFSDVLTAPTCNLQGGAGADNLAGGAGDELICGFAAGDTINAGGGRDAVLAGEGDDTIDVADGQTDALVDCGPGTDTVDADSKATDPAAIFVNCETVNRPADPTPPGGEDPGGSTPGPTKIYKCKGKRATIVGTSKKETIKGTKKADVIVALGGNDTIKGFGGNDTICGGNGKDTIKGGPGKDLLRGEVGNDRVFGEKGNDRLDGGKGKDTLRGGSGNDRLKGNAGKGDLCDGQSGKKDKLDGKKAGCEKRKRIP